MKKPIQEFLSGTPTKKPGRKQISEATRKDFFGDLSKLIGVPANCFDVRAISEANATTRSASESIGRRFQLSKDEALPEWIFMGRVGKSCDLKSIAKSMKEQLDGTSSIAVLFAEKNSWEPYHLFYAKGKEELAQKILVFLGNPDIAKEEIAPVVPMGVEKRKTGAIKGDVARNVIFYGPPGTGKSFLVDERVDGTKPHRIQFHPEYSNAEFVGAYKPVVGYEKGSQIKISGFDGKEVDRPVNYFSFVPGPLVLALVDALKSQDHVYLIIEEINRGDCAAIFGDYFQLLDRKNDGRSQYGITPSVELINFFKYNNVNYDICGDGKLYLPENLSMIATMNTSDQNLYPMDSAFKRRWQWVACPINFDSVIKYTGGVRPYLNDGKTKWDWIKLISEINKKIVSSSMEDKQIGPWFIKPATDGSVCWEAFLNKCLFYLWHDVFKDEQTHDHSPFKLDGPDVFGEMQVRIGKDGLAAGFKAEILANIGEGIRVADASLQQGNIDLQDS